MAQSPQNANIVTATSDLISRAHRFSHDAMATTFELFILLEDAGYARQAAAAAFAELDRLEEELSRFIENSDISRINNLAANSPLQIGPAAFESLQICANISAQTNGAFDITIGSLLDCWLGRDKKIRKPSQQELDFARRHTGSTLLQLDRTNYTVQLSASYVKIDLGGFGKGYAVDRMADLMQDWSIETVLISSGGSSVFALGAPKGTKGWPVTLSNPQNRKQTLAHLHLENRAVSGSGLQKGRHIIDPRTTLPARRRPAAWSCAPDAATADALSTAFMVMSTDRIRQYCSTHPDTLAMLITEGQGTQKKRVLRFGQWNAEG